MLTNFGFRTHGEQLNTIGQVQELLSLRSMLLSQDMLGDSNCSCISTVMSRPMATIGKPAGSRTEVFVRSCNKCSVV